MIKTEDRNKLTNMSGREGRLFHSLFRNIDECESSIIRNIQSNIRIAKRKNKYLEDINKLIKSIF